MPRRAKDLLMVPVVATVALFQDIIWPALQSAGDRIVAWPPLLPTRRWIGRLPAVVALPLFLVPEAFSRVGTLVSAWLLLYGDGWRALAIYAATKVFAGGTALWIYTACEPALLRIKLFATLHAAMGRQRRAWLAHIRGRTNADRSDARSPPS